MKRLTSFQAALFSKASPRNHYDVLGLPRQATEEDIKAAYYKLAKQFHPDIHPQYGQKFKEISEAYNILKDSTKRMDYDNLFHRAATKQNVESVSKTFYNTHFHYGYTDKFNKQPQQRYRYESNPFAADSSMKFSNEFTRDMFKSEDDNKRRSNLKSMNNSVKFGLMGIFSAVLVAILVEMMLALYNFNHEKQKVVGKGKATKDIY